MKKTFSKEYLRNLDLPDGIFNPSGVRIIRDTVEHVERWSVVHELTFSLPGQDDGTAWQTEYSVGATECQDESPWEYVDEVECTLVREVEVTVKQWKEVES